MASAFPQSLAMLIAFWLNGVLHGKFCLKTHYYMFSNPPATGIYLILFIQWAINPRHWSAALYFMAFCWMAFLISNLDFGINLYLMIKGFWFSLPQGGPDVFFEDPKNWQTVLREIISQLLVTAGDTLMVIPSLVIPITLLMPLLRSIAYTASGAATSTLSSSPSPFSSQKQ
jgi:hypothetical protein